VIQRLWAKDAEHVPTDSERNWQQTQPTLLEWLKSSQFCTPHPDEISRNSWDQKRVTPVTWLSPREHKLPTKEIEEDNNNERNQHAAGSDEHSIR
jgi:hypothetical protein